VLFRSVAAQVILSGHAEVASSAAEVGVDGDAVAGPHPRPLSKRERGVYFHNFPCTVRAGDVGVFQFQAGPAVAHPQVHAVEGRGVQSHKGFTRAGFGGREVGILKNLRVSMLVEKDCFHQRSFYGSPGYL
jgi:hypothetical protein